MNSKNNNMQNIITRYCINPEILFPEYDTDTGELVKTHDYNDFCHLINRWKIILVKKYNVQPGQTIFLLAGPNLYYYSLFFAAAELGLVFIVDWPHVFLERDLEDPKVVAHGQIDYIFIHSDFHKIDSLHAKPYWEIQRNLKFGKNLLYQDEFYNYTITKSEGITDIVNAIWASPESDLIYSTSSGTTGPPKKFTDSHKKVYLTAKRLANLYFTKNKSVLHYKTMHHGASMAIHFLPGFMTGGKQFTAEGTNGDHNSMDPVIQFVMDNKINQLFLYNVAQITYFLKNMPRADHCVNIVTLYQITPEIVALIKEKNINWVKTVFGDTTIGIGFFIKTVNQTTDILNYEITNLGKPLDDFFQFELRNGNLYISCPALNEDYRTSNDIFEIINGDYYFKGRANQYRINGEWIKLNEIEQKVQQLFGIHGANIVVDAEHQKIYLAIWEENLQAETELITFFTKNYESVNISYVLRNEDYNQFFNSRKIDNSKIRMVCRQQILTNQG